MSLDIRNIGIIAHVDHGKTTLVDCLLKEGGLFRANEAVADRMMDSMDLEREKGITIKSKNVMVNWKGTTINIVDTPGHADFGGEVERILGMVDGVLLLVDAAEGAQAQTRFVLRKALEQGLPLIVLVNKIDREFADPHKAHDDVLGLLMELHATEDQFNAPFLYASARDGYAVHDLDDERVNMQPVFETIVKRIPPPDARPDEPLKMLVSNLGWNDYVGRIAEGKLQAGRVAVGDSIVCIHHDGSRERTKISKLYKAKGLGTAEAAGAQAGEIVGIAGFPEVSIGETLCDSEEREPIPFVEIDPPTIQMQVFVNDGPLAGKDGKFVTARHIGERLMRETRTNVSMEVKESAHSSSFIVNARGELQIAVVVETMRREGYEVMLSRPEVIYRNEDGRRLEPFESLWIEIPNESLGDAMQAIAARKGDITHMEHEGNHVLLEAVMPTRGLIGLQTLLTNISSGQAVVSHMFKEYGPLCGAIPNRSTGALVSMEAGTATGYALDTIQERGRLFIAPGDEVYAGMVVGENARPDDLPVNPTRTKQLTNVRASGTDKAITLEPPVNMSLERAIEFIAGDEYVEVTPKFMRLRKKILDANQRKRAANAAKATG